MNKPCAIIIAGPNGAGKTTFAREFLAKEASCPTFINADLIAGGLSPFQPENMAAKAMRIMLESVRENLNRRASFAVETTLAGKSYIKNIPEWQQLGYDVRLYFLKLSSVELAIQRVAFRVREGGHNIPEDVIRRRYKNGWLNFTDKCKYLVNSWRLYNGDNCPPVFIEGGDKNDF